jgi:integrase/recombinase XerD
VTALAPSLEAFFTQRLVRQRRCSPNTVAAYRDAWRLLLTFAQERTGRPAADLEVADLDTALIGAFLEYLEIHRGNGARSRNARLAAIHSFFRFASLRHPEHAETLARVLAIPAKRTDRAEVSYLTPAEADALVGAPDIHQWTGRRDRALLLLALQTGLRVSEIVGLRNRDVDLGAAASVRCWGKGRKERCTPVRPATARVLRDWMTERRGAPDDPLFPTSRGTPLSRDAIGALVARHARVAATSSPTLAGKRVTPHVLRHSCAMALLHGGVDRSVLALWLGHEQVETTQIYIHADMTLKQRALDRTTPQHVPPGRYRPPDRLLAFLADL